MNIPQCIGYAASYYNLGLVLIAIILFIKLFTTPIKDKRVYLMPWKLIFFAVLVYIVEEVLTILRVLDVINIPRHINGFFELIMICTFIYMLLLQKEHMKLTRKK